MLRRNKFRPFETKIVWGIALVLLAVGVVGAVLAVYRGDWRLLLVSAGIGGLAIVYICAARRGRPL